MVEKNVFSTVKSTSAIYSQPIITFHVAKDYKTTSIPIALDWLIRHGLLTAETEPDITEILAEIHTPLHKLYPAHLSQL